jgi:acetyl-CoA C-acetyltransferase
MSAETARAHNLPIMCYIHSYAQGALKPEEFTVAPTIAVKKVYTFIVITCAHVFQLLSRANLTVANIDLWEINEAFSVTSLANMRDLGITDMSCINVHGGAVAMGHPLGHVQFINNQSVLFIECLALVSCVTWHM